MGDAATFHGYAPDLGYEFLRSAIAKNDYKDRGCDIEADEIFVSDGAKSDSEISRKYSDWITRLQCATLYTQYM